MRMRRKNDKKGEENIWLDTWSWWRRKGRKIFGLIWRRRMGKESIGEKYVREGKCIWCGTIGKRRGRRREGQAIFSPVTGQTPRSETNLHKRWRKKGWMQFVQERDNIRRRGSCGKPLRRVHRTLHRLFGNSLDIMIYIFLFCTSSFNYFCMLHFSFFFTSATISNIVGFKNSPVCGCSEA